MKSKQNVTQKNLFRPESLSCCKLNLRETEMTKFFTKKH